MRSCIAMQIQLFAVTDIFSATISRGSILEFMNFCIIYDIEFSNLSNKLRLTNFLKVSL
jgi:hypothetical protein